MTDQQIAAIVFTLDGSSKSNADQAIEHLEAAFNMKLNLEWCSMCSAYRRPNTHTHK